MSEDYKKLLTWWWGFFCW